MLKKRLTLKRGLRYNLCRLSHYLSADLHILVYQMAQYIITHDSHNTRKTNPKSLESTSFPNKMITFNGIIFINVDNIVL